MTSTSPHVVSPHLGTVAVGSEAPGWSLRDTPHSRVGLHDFAGRAIVLVFHVADWDPVAVVQLRLLEELRPHLDRLGAVVVAISADTVWSHAAFAARHGLTMPFVADDDPPGSVARAYGVADPTGLRSMRAIVVIGPDGVVRWTTVVPDIVDPGADGILAALEGLGRASRDMASPLAHGVAGDACRCGCGLPAGLTSTGD